MDEVSVIGRVDVDIDGLDKLGDDQAAVAPVEPVEAVYLRPGSPRYVRTAAVHAFTGDGTPLVLGKRGLMRAGSAARSGEEFDHLRAVAVGPGRGAAGPFTPAPPGLVAEFATSSQPILFFDRYGRPVLIDNDDEDPQGRNLYLARNDEDLVRITGTLGAWPSASSSGGPNGSPEGQR